MISSGADGDEPDALTLNLPATRETPGRARREIDRWLTSRAVAAGTRDAVALVVSELVTNAVIHAGTDAVVEVTKRGADLRIGVNDRSRAGPVSRPGGAGGGFGLGIVDRAAQRWGWQRTTSGKTVWAEIRIDHDEADARH